MKEHSAMLVDQPTVINAIGTIRTRDAAERFGVSKEWLDQEIANGHIPSTRPIRNGPRYVYACDLRALRLAGSIRMLPTPAGTLADHPSWYVQVVAEQSRG